MQVIKVTDYNFIELLEVDYKDENIIFRWNNDGKKGRKRKAKIRYKLTNGIWHKYFNTYNLLVSLEGRI